MIWYQLIIFSVAIGAMIFGALANSTAWVNLGGFGVLYAGVAWV